MRYMTLPQPYLPCSPAPSLSRCITEHPLWKSKVLAVARLMYYDAWAPSTPLMLQGLFAKSSYATNHNVKVEWSLLLQEEVAKAYKADGGFRSITNSRVMQSTLNKLGEACEPFLELGTLYGRTLSLDYRHGQVEVLTGRTPLARRPSAPAVAIVGGAHQLSEWLFQIETKLTARWGHLSVWDVVPRLAAFLVLYYIPSVLVKQYLS